MIDATAFRHAMGRFATGVTVISAQCGETMHGMTANAVCSVSLEPLLLLVSVHSGARMLRFLRDAGAFAVNILSAEQAAVSRHFAGAKAVDPPEYRFVPWEAGPRLVGCLSAIGCHVERVLPAGDHHLVLGRVVAIGTDATAPRHSCFGAGATVSWRNSQSKSGSLRVRRRSRRGRWP